MQHAARILQPAARMKINADPEGFDPSTSAPSQEAGARRAPIQTPEEICGSEDQPLVAMMTATPAAAGSSSPQISPSYSIKDWLISQGKTKATVNETVNYSRKYCHILDSGDASQLLTLSPRNKHHAMTALANYAKYTGRYDEWLKLRQAIT